MFNFIILKCFKDTQMMGKYISTKLMKLVHAMLDYVTLNQCSTLLLLYVLLYVLLLLSLTTPPNLHIQK